MVAQKEDDVVQSTSVDLHELERNLSGANHERQKSPLHLPIKCLGNIKAVTSYDTFMNVRPYGLSRYKVVGYKKLYDTLKSKMNFHELWIDNESEMPRLKGNEVPWWFEMIRFLVQLSPL